MARIKLTPYEVGWIAYLCILALGLIVIFMMSGCAVQINRIEFSCMGTMQEDVLIMSCADSETWRQHHIRQKQI
jgi:hypothetical protein